MIGKFEFIVIVMLSPSRPNDSSMAKPIVRWRAHWLRMLTTSWWKPVILRIPSPPSGSAGGFPAVRPSGSSNRHAPAATGNARARRHRSAQVDPDRGHLFLRNISIMVALAVLEGCTPALDWRAVALPGSDLEVQLPCRPGRFQREVVVAGRPLTLFMLSCEAAGATYGVATADVDDVTRVNAVLAAFAQSARDAILTPNPEFTPFSLPGSTPFDQSVSAHLHGHRPDGSSVEESLRLFARGTRIFEASVIGARLPDSGTRPFEDGLRFDLENRKTDPR